MAPSGKHYRSYHAVASKTLFLQYVFLGDDVQISVYDVFLQTVPT